MKRSLIVLVITIIFTALWAVPIVADDTTAKESTVTSSESTSSDDTAGKHAKDSTSTSTQTTKEAEAKLEADKRAEVESRSRRERSRGGRYSHGSSAETSGGSGLSFGFGSGSQNAGVIVSPGGGDRKPAMGIQWMSPKGVGISFWASGDLSGPSDLIDATIPHSDFYLDSTRGSYAIEVMFALSQKNPTVTLGVGVCTTKVWNYAVSNATGWRWSEGTDRIERFAGQIGCRFRVSDRMSFQYAYDTIQHSFFGLTADF